MHPAPPVRAGHPETRAEKADSSFLADENLTDSVRDDPMLAIPKRPDRDAQPVLAFSECGDRRVAFAELADDFSGRKRDMPAAPFDQKVRRMVGDFRDVAP